MPLRCLSFCFTEYFSEVMWSRKYLDRPQKLAVGASREGRAQGDRRPLALLSHVASALLLLRCHPHHPPFPPPLPRIEFCCSSLSPPPPSPGLLYICHLFVRTPTADSFIAHASPLGPHMSAPLEDLLWGLTRGPSWWPMCWITGPRALSPSTPRKMSF